MLTLDRIFCQVESICHGNASYAALVQARQPSLDISPVHWTLYVHVNIDEHHHDEMSLDLSLYRDIRDPSFQDISKYERDSGAISKQETIFDFDHGHCT
jgi:hypothetical protein